MGMNLIRNHSIQYIFIFSVRSTQSYFCSPLNFFSVLSGRFLILSQGGGGEEGASEAKSGAAGELLFWNKSLQPTGLEGEDYYWDVVPK